MASQAQKTLHNDGATPRSPRERRGGAIVGLGGHIIQLNREERTEIDKLGPNLFWT